MKGSLHIDVYKRQVFGEIMSEGMCMEIAEADHAGIPIRYFTKQNGEFVERSSL